MDTGLGSGNYGNITEMLSDKHPNTIEIEVTFFENCDVVCSFCGHEKESTEGMSSKEMFAKLKSIEKFLDTANKNVAFANVHLLGGELLQDRLMTGDKDCYLELYYSWLEDYKKICEDRGFNPRCVIVTNNLTTKVEMVKDFLDTVRDELMPCDLIVSYDMSGRPITRQYRHNLGYFKDYISNINMVATSASMKKIMRNDDAFFKQLYCDFEIYIDDFLPDPESEHLIPSDELLLEFMHFCRKEFPKIMPYSWSVEVMEKELCEMVEISGSTLNKTTILPDGRVTNYAWDRHKPEMFNRPFILEDNTNMLYDFVMENDCLSCEHFDYCHMRCPVLWSWKNRERSEGCVNKRFYDAINNEEV